jgi:hypothetical protein
MPNPETNKPRIERFIEGIGLQTGRQLTELLSRFKRDEISEERIEEEMNEAVKTALNTVKAQK